MLQEILKWVSLKERDFRREDTDLLALVLKGDKRNPITFFFCFLPSAERAREKETRSFKKGVFLLKWRKKRGLLEVVSSE